MVAVQGFPAPPDGLLDSAFLILLMQWGSIIAGTIFLFASG
ncbi:hypothetical protein imdm_1232 [gamma proteobacterium IMCC2047]|nr:hypothetical protein imdm_1232 [gamma proteobacterium IMCC2047]